MTIYSVEKQSEITGNTISLTEVSTYEKAYDLFARMADYLGYNYEPTEKDTRNECGGMGHDYRITLHVTQLTGNPTL